MTKSKRFSLSSLIVIASLLITGVIVLSLQLTNNALKNSVLYTVSFDTQGGSELPSITVREGEKIKRPDDPLKNGYLIDDWKYNNETWVFESNTVTSDIKLVASWTYKQYSISYDFNGGTTAEPYKNDYNIASSFELIRPTKQGVIFGGWFDQYNHRVDKIQEGMTGDLTLTAKWLEKLVLKSLDESRGTVAAYSEDNDMVTVISTPINKKYHLFKGWYDENNVLLSNEMLYRFKVSVQETKYLYAVYMNDEEEESWNIDHGVLPSVTNDYATFGMYPQSNVSDTNIISKLNKLERSDLNRYYYYDHEYYFKQNASLYSLEETEANVFDNGFQIEDGQTYWFKVEPIKWMVLKTTGSQVMLLSNKLLNTMDFYLGPTERMVDDIYPLPNNYKYSNLRKWLNNDFYNQSFCFNSNPIIETVVLNDASTTHSPTNPYICESTNDFVFELSYQEYLTENLGFDTGSGISLTRSFKTTDLARASNAGFGLTGSYKHMGYTWTRSPFDTNNGGLSASKITYGGVINNAWVGTHYICVQPCINLLIS